jgi:hypothetical protein
MSLLHRTNITLAILAALPPLAHVLELPNKFALDGVLWLAVQQHLYRGWGPFLGGPAEIGALATSLALLAIRRANGETLRLTIIATIAYAAMLGAYFVLNAPVNEALNAWTPATLPSDWPMYRLRWEVGHALAASTSVVGLATLVRARIVEVLQAGRRVASATKPGQVEQDSSV